MGEAIVDFGRSQHLTGVLALNWIVWAERWQIALKSRKRKKSNYKTIAIIVSYTI